MLGDTIPLDDIIPSGEIDLVTDNSWPPLPECEDEDGTGAKYDSVAVDEVGWFPDDDICQAMTEPVGCSKGVEDEGVQADVEEGRLPDDDMCQLMTEPVGCSKGLQTDGEISGAQAFNPAGLKVLVVDDNCVCLAIMEKMLKVCNYAVTTCNSAATALSLVRDKGTPIDLVLCDVHMPDMDGFKLLDALLPVRELPVIMMSSDDGTDVVMKGITLGACDYFLKPVCLQRLQTIWQHVYRRREMMESAKDGDCLDSEAGRGSKVLSDRDNPRKRKGKEELTDDQVEFGNGHKKKSRLVWTSPLHKKFVDAVRDLGTANAVPKQILERMNVKGISRENVASHLQKYRKYLIDQDTQHEDGKGSGGGMSGQSYQLEPFQPGGHFGGGSLEIHSPPFSSATYKRPAPLNSAMEAMHSFHTSNGLSSIHSPIGMPSLHSHNSLSPLNSANVLPSHRSPNPMSSIHSPNTMPTCHPSNTLSSLLPSNNTIPTHHCPSNLSSIHSPNTGSSHSVNNISSLNTSGFNTLNPVHSLHSLGPLLSARTVASLQSPHGMSFPPSRQTMSSFPPDGNVPSLHSLPTTSSFPSASSSFQSVPQLLSPEYSVNTDLYPTPSQSFQAAETAPFRPVVTPDQSFDLASSSNFSNRVRQFSENIFSPSLVTPSFYNQYY